MRISTASKAHNRQLWLFDQPLGSHGHARYIIGDLIEDCTAALFGGRRHKTDSQCDYCPDVSVGDAYLECKAMGCSGQTFIYAGRLQKDIEFAKTHSLFYAIWHHTAAVAGHDTVPGLCLSVLRRLQWVAVLPFAEVALICSRLKEEPLNSAYGKSSGAALYGSGFRIPKSKIKPWVVVEFAPCRND